MNNGKPTKVLIIDDDTAMCETLKLVLEPHAFSVFEARSGEQGIEICKQVNPDVIILDLLMPGMDGWQVTRTVRSFSEVPILVLSAVSSPEMVAKALDDGVDEYLIKPVPANVLVAHLKRLSRRARVENDAHKPPASNLETHQV